VACWHATHRWLRPFPPTSYASTKRYAMPPTYAECAGDAAHARRNAVVNARAYSVGVAWNSGRGGRCAEVVGRMVVVVCRWGRVTPIPAMFMISPRCPFVTTTVADA